MPDLIIKSSKSEGMIFADVQIPQDEDSEDTKEEDDPSSSQDCAVSAWIQIAHQMINLKPM